MYCLHRYGFRPVHEFRGIESVSVYIFSGYQFVTVHICGGLWSGTVDDFVGYRLESLLLLEDNNLDLLMGLSENVLRACLTFRLF